MQDITLLYGEKASGNSSFVQEVIDKQRHEKEAKAWMDAYQEGRKCFKPNHNLIDTDLMTKKSIEGFTRGILEKQKKYDEIYKTNAKINQIKCSAREYADKDAKRILKNIVELMDGMDIRENRADIVKDATEAYMCTIKEILK